MNGSRLGDEDDAGRQFVQAADERRARAARPPPSMPDEKVHQRSGRLRVRRVYDDSRRFVDREQVMVFEKDVERAGIRLDAPREGESGFGNNDRQHVAGRDSRRDAANGFAIDADGSSIDPRLNSGAGG